MTYSRVNVTFLEWFKETSMMGEGRTCMCMNIQHNGLKFEEETSIMLHLEHGFVWC